MNARTCVHCGCNDANDIRPEFNLEWILLHEHTNTGVCSHCAEAALLHLVVAINKSDFPIIVTYQVDGRETP